MCIADGASQMPRLRRAACGTDRTLYASCTVAAYHEVALLQLSMPDFTDAALPPVVRIRLGQDNMASSSDGCAWTVDVNGIVTAF